MSPAKVRYGSAAASALLMTAAFPPIGFRFLAWIALVPWLVVLLRDRGEGHRGPGYVFGLVHFTTGLAWLFRLHPLFPLGLSAILALYPLLFAYLFRKIARLGPGRAALAIPVLWIAVDFLREHLATGFPWLLPGHVAAGWPNLRQAADLGGEHLLTLVVVSVDAYWAWVIAVRLRDSFRQAWSGGRLAFFVAVTVLPLALAAYGSSRRGSLVDKSGPRVLLIQPALPMELKGEALKEQDATAVMRNEQLSLSMEGLRLHPEETDLVVWAETMIPGVVRPRARDRDVPDPGTTRDLVSIADPMGVVPGSPRRFLSGALIRDPDLHLRNGVLLVGPHGRIEARADKVHLTPFGEFIPGLNLLPGPLRNGGEKIVKLFSPFIPDLRSGPAEPIPLAMEGGRTVRLGGLVCYEVIFPVLARERTRAGADVLVNLSNYGWYGESIQEQVLDITRLRAVECRRPVVVATVSGPTCVVDGNGEVRERLPAGKRAFLHAEVPLDGRGTLYGSTGDVLPWACLVLAAGAVGAGIAAGRRARKGGGESAVPDPEKV
jgi:apolipoprotein N-acyltransferase